VREMVDERWERWEGTAMKDKERDRGTPYLHMGGWGLFTFS